MYTYISILQRPPEKGQNTTKIQKGKKNSKVERLAFADRKALLRGHTTLNY